MKTYPLNYKYNINNCKNKMIVLKKQNIRLHITVRKFKKMKKE